MTYNQLLFYHIKNLQSTKTAAAYVARYIVFYHIKNLQSTKTLKVLKLILLLFYHIKNLQSTKTIILIRNWLNSFITLRIYKVLKPRGGQARPDTVLSH